MPDVEKLIIVPAYQEREWIGGVLRMLNAFRASNNQSVMEGYDVLVVDDGSTDGTGDLARSQGFNVLTHPERLGKTRGVLDGVEHARENNIPFIATIDADTTNLHLDMVPWLMDPVAGGRLDMAIGMMSDSPHDFNIYNYMFSGQRAYNTRVFDPLYDPSHPQHPHWKFMLSFKWPEPGLRYLIPKDRMQLIKSFVFEQRPALRPGMDGTLNELFQSEQGKCAQAVDHYANEHGLTDGIPFDMLVADSRAISNRNIGQLRPPRREFF